MTRIFQVKSGVNAAAVSFFLIVRPTKVRFSEHSYNSLLLYCSARTHRHSSLRERTPACQGAKVLGCIRLMLEGGIIAPQKEQG